MDSLDAQCLVFDLAESEDARPPDQWEHRADGRLAYRFGTSPNSFSWPGDSVAEMAARWRACDRPVPELIAGLVRSHLAFAKLVEESDLTPPARIFHDLRTGEITARWDDEKLLVVVEPGEEAAPVTNS